MLRRPRRLRKSAAIRDLVRETVLNVNDLIYPLFVVEGENIKEEIPSLPEVYHFSLDKLEEEIKEINNEVVFKFESRERTDKQLFIRLLEKNKENILFRFGDKPAFVYKYKDMKKESVLEKFKEILDDLVSYKNK